MDIAAAISFCRFVSGLAFFGLGILALREWRSTRDRGQLLIALAVGLLGVVSLLGRIGEMGGWAGRLLSGLSIVGILGSSAALMEFRHKVVPLKPITRGIVHGSVVVLGVPALLVRWPREAGADLAAWQAVIGWGIVLLWVATMLEPAIRFARVARTRPAIERARLRLLAAAYFGMLTIIAAALARPQNEEPTGYSLGLSIAGVALVPLLYGALTPPAWLRRRWLIEEVQREQQRLLLTLPAIVWTTDDDLRLLSMSGAGISRPEHQAARVVGKRLEDLWREEGVLEEPVIQHALEMHRRALGGESVTFDATYAGNTYQSRIEPIHGGDGRVAGVVALSVDITARKIAEDATRDAFEREHLAATHLRALDEMKNAFMSAVSHELRTPLSGVVRFAETLQLEDRLSVEDRRAILQRLIANAHKLERLLTDLLDLDRLTRGIVEPLRKRTDVGALAIRIAEEWRAEAERPVYIDIEPVVAMVDGPKVERIIENLLANAAKYTPPDTPVWVKVKREEGGVAILVEDAGAGVPEELRDSMFEPFQRGDAYVGHAPGFGIGLSLVARFAELHGGRVSVSDREGGGASFRVFLASPDVERRAAARPWFDPAGASAV